MPASRMSSPRSRSGGSVDPDDVEAVVEVLAEALARRPRARGRGWSPRRRATSNGTSCVRADRAHGALLERAQQLGLQRRAAARRSRRGRACRRRPARRGPARESRASVNAPRAWPKSSLSRSAAGIAAQLTATNGPRARRLVRGRARDELLARAGLALDEDGRHASGKVEDELTNPLHLFALTDETGNAQLEWLDVAFHEQARLGRSLRLMDQ